MKIKLGSGLLIFLMVFGILCVRSLQAPDGVTGATRRVQYTPGSSAVSMPGIGALKTFDGQVESVSGASSASGIRQKIVAVNRAGERISFVIRTDTRVYDKNMTDPSIAKVNKGEHIIVKYTTDRSGRNTANTVTAAE